MTATYDDYRRALAQLRDLPNRIAADLDETQQSHVRADALAQDAISAAEVSAAETLKAIEAQLGSARGALETLGKSNLVPPRIRPSSGAKAATSGEVLNARQSLTTAVSRLRQAVQAEKSRIEAERHRLAQEEAERKRLAREGAEQAAAAAARRKRLIYTGVAATLTVVALIVILAIAL